MSHLSIRKPVCFLAAAIVFCSCGSYEKLLKSNDFDVRYKGALEYYKNQKNNKARALLDAVEVMYVNTEREDTVKFYKAKSIYRNNDFETSGMLFDEFRRNFGRSPFLEEAEFLYAMSHYYMSPHVEQDQTETANAIVFLQEYLSRYPNSPKAQECRNMIDEMGQKLDKKAFLSAKTYYDIRYYNSAILTFKNALKKYPDSRYREEILYLIVRSNYLYAKNSVEAKQRSRYLDMLDAYYNFISEYPQSKHAGDAVKMHDYVQKWLKANGEGLTSDKNVKKQFDKEERKLEGNESKKDKRLSKKAGITEEMPEATPAVAE